MGGSEIIVILIVALLFLGPDKLPQAAKSISKGIRDIKKQSRALQQQIESDEQIGGAIRDLKSALRGEELPVRPKPIKPPPAAELPEVAAVGVTAALGEGDGVAAPLGDGSHAAPLSVDEAAAVAAQGAAAESTGEGAAAAAEGAAATSTASAEAAAEAASAPANDAGEHRPLKLPPTAGEPDPVESAGGDDDLAAMIKPAPGTVAKGS
jgi:sec-independent protein translocase protein TatB